MLEGDEWQELCFRASAAAAAATEMEEAGADPSSSSQGWQTSDTGHTGPMAPPPRRVPSFGHSVPQPPPLFSEGGARSSLETVVGGGSTAGPRALLEWARAPHGPRRLLPASTRPPSIDWQGGRQSSDLPAGWAGGGSGTSQIGENAAWNSMPTASTRGSSVDALLDARRPPSFEPPTTATTAATAAVVPRLSENLHQPPLPSPHGACRAGKRERGGSGAEPSTKLLRRSASASVLPSDSVDAGSGRGVPTGQADALRAYALEPGALGEPLELHNWPLQRALAASLAFLMHDARVPTALAAPVRAAWQQTLQARTGEVQPTLLEAVSACMANYERARVRDELGST